MRYFCLRCGRPVDRGALERHKGLQIMDSRNVAGREHVEFALREAERAFEDGVNLSRELPVEVLVRASAQKQINRGFELFGIEDTREVVVIGDMLPEEFVKEFDCEEMELEMDRGRYERVKRAFGIDEDEIAALSSGTFESRYGVLMELVKERIALLRAL